MNSKRLPLEHVLLLLTSRKKRIKVVQEKLMKIEQFLLI